MTLPSPSILFAAALLAMGVVAGYRALVRRRHRAAARRAYLKGFRYILSDNPDAALEELTRAVDVDARTSETYFALGALFRRTGEHERAIRLHRNMLLRPELSPRLKQQIELELGLDYQRAGMSELAVECYQRLLASEPGQRDALVRLREIFEQKKDFARAAQAEGTLVEAGEGSRSILAHLLAEAALVEADPETARAFAERAEQVAPQSAHAALARGLVALKAGAGSAAAGALERACQLDPELAPVVAAPLERASAKASAYFQSLLARGDHPAVRIALAQLLLEAGEPEAASGHLRRALELDRNSVQARVELCKALLESGTGAPARQELEELLQQLGQQEHPFQCTACGHGSPELQLRCERCLKWDTMRRIAAPGATLAIPAPRG
jgi:lipopolysaccharide biosynthesis regulator YciM